MRKLSKHVDEGMVTHSDTAIQKHIKNELTETTFKNACKVSLLLIDVIVDYYIKKYGSNCKPLISSFLRTPKLNVAIGGSSTSRHCFADAVDLNISGISAKQIFNDIISGRIKQPSGKPLKDIIDQMIYEKASSTNIWCHVALNSSLLKPRNMYMVANFGKRGTTYTNVSKEI